MGRKVTKLLIASFMILIQLAINIPVIAATAIPTPEIKVLPWNGAKASVSLTFDDGYDSHRKIVIPALDKIGMKATFYVCAQNIGEHNEDWIAAGSEGHEIGNHSIHHLDPTKLTEAQEYDETVGAQKQLQDAYKTQVVSYDYPYTNPANLKKYLENTHVSARGGWGFSYYMNPSTTPDWLNIPAQATRAWTTDTKPSFATDYKKWIDTALSQSAWTVFMIHDIGQDSLQVNEFNQLINYLDSNKSDIWVAPFATVSGYWRAQKVFESTKPSATSNGNIYNWEVPSFFPQDINIKAKMANGTDYQIVQSGKTLVPDSNGVYTISFNTGSLEVVKKSESDDVVISVEGLKDGGYTKANQVRVSVNGESGLMKTLKVLRDGKLIDTITRNSQNGTNQEETISDKIDSQTATESAVKVSTTESALKVSDVANLYPITIDLKEDGKYELVAELPDKQISFKFVYDSKLPTISYDEITKNVTVADENLETVTVNGTARDKRFTLSGDGTYKVEAVDKAGNRIVKDIVISGPVISSSSHSRKHSKSKSDKKDIAAKDTTGKDTDVKDDDAKNTNASNNKNNESKIIVDGWKKNDNNTWVYIKAGQNATGWQQVKGTWYLLKDDGVMATGWKQVNNKWYLLKDDGAMATGWQQINGKWYYLYSDGSMASNTIIDSYQLDENGAWIV